MGIRTAQLTRPIAGFAALFGLALVPRRCPPAQGTPEQRAACETTRCGCAANSFRTCTASPPACSAIARYLSPRCRAVFAGKKKPR